jgi:hypothetical protein
LGKSQGGFDRIRAGFRLIFEEGKKLLYALNAMLDLQATATRADIEKAIEGKIVARGAFTGKVKGS